MQATIRLLNEIFGLKYYFTIPVGAIIIILGINGGEYELLEMINPVNVGILTALAMMSFSSGKGTIILAKLLPTTAGIVAGALQVYLYLMIFTVNISILLLYFILRLILLTDVAVWQATGHLLFNAAFLIIVSNIMLPIMLLKRFKPLKIAVICIMLPMPFIVGETAGVAAERLAGAAGAQTILTACAVFYVVAFLTGILCYHLTKGRVKAYEA